VLFPGAEVGLTGFAVLIDATGMVIKVGGEDGIGTTGRVVKTAGEDGSGATGTVGTAACEFRICPSGI